jgi:hypothetical protein
MRPATGAAATIWQTRNGVGRGDIMSLKPIKEKAANAAYLNPSAGGYRRTLPKEQHNYEKEVLVTNSQDQ